METERHLDLCLRDNGNRNQDRAFQARKGKVCQGVEVIQVLDDFRIPSLRTERHAEV
jgi:hypothetical protein